MMNAAQWPPTLTGYASATMRADRPSGHRSFVGTCRPVDECRTRTRRVAPPRSVRRDERSTVWVDPRSRFGLSRPVARVQCDSRRGSCRATGSGWASRSLRGVPTPTTAHRPRAGGPEATLVWSAAIRRCRTRRRSAFAPRLRSGRGRRCAAPRRHSQSVPWSGYLGIGAMRRPRALGALVLPQAGRGARAPHGPCR